MSLLEVPCSTATSTTVASVKITLNIPAKIGMRVWIVAVGWQTDLAGSMALQGGSAGTTTLFLVPSVADSATIVNKAFTPAVPFPISDTGVAANVVVNVTTTGRVSAVYFYAP